MASSSLSSTLAEEATDTASTGVDGSISKKDFSKVLDVAKQLFEDTFAKSDVKLDHGSMIRALFVAVKFIHNSPRFQYHLLQKAEEMIMDTTTEPKSSSDSNGMKVSKEDATSQPQCLHRPSKQQLEKLAENVELSNIAYTESTKELKSILADKFPDLALLSHDPLTDLHKVSHFIAFDKNSRELVIGIKGTSSAEDVMTDLVAVPMTHYCQPYCPFTGEENNEDDQDSNNPCTIIHGHEGILRASLELSETISPFIEYWCQPMKLPIRIVGHSLGGGVAAILAVLLKSKYTYLHEDLELEGSKEESENKLGGLLSSLLPPSTKKEEEKNKTKQPKSFLHAYCIEPPPVLNIAACRSSSNFITTLVNNDDLIPRCSIGNLTILMKGMEYLDRRLKEDYNIKSEWDLTKENFTGEIRSKITTKDMDSLLEEMNKLVQNVEVDHNDHLYVPGMITLIYETLNEEIAEKELESPTATTTVAEGETLVVEIDTEKEREESSATITSAPATPPARDVQLKAVILDDNSHKALRVMNLVSNCVENHLLDNITKSMKEVIDGK